MLAQARSQRLCDQIQLKELASNLAEMRRCLDNLTLAKVINKTRVIASLNGVSKCRKDIQKFQENKKKMLIEKQFLLNEQEIELKA